MQMLRTLMLQFTKEPSTEEYMTICSKLVLKYHTLQDDSKSGYVSHAICSVLVIHRVATWVCYTGSHLLI